MDITNLRGLVEAYQQVYASVDEAVYGGEQKKPAAPADTRMTVTAADKKANTKAYQNYKAGHKGYKAADHLGEDSFDEATAMAKRGHDETAIRNKIAKSTGGGEAADRATKLADKQTFRGDGSARDNLARKQRGDFRKTTSSSPGLHGYPHKSNDPAVKEKQAARGAQRGVLTPDEKKRLNREEFDVFETVLEFLCVEGYAETFEEAEWMMANIIDEEAISIIIEASCEDCDEEDDEEEVKKGKKSKEEEEDEDLEEEYIDEAEGSYGQTPKARAAMSKLAISRMNKPASEYSQKGEKTKKMKAAQKQTRRQDTLSRGLSGGKKSSRPRYSGGRGQMDADERAERRAERAFDGENTYGAGSVTKNPKKLRKQKAMGEFAKEAFESWLDEAMTNYEKNRKRAAQRAAARNDARAQGKTGAVPGVGYVTPRKERETWTDESGKTRHAKGL